MRLVGLVGLMIACHLGTPPLALGQCEGVVSSAGVVAANPTGNGSFGRGVALSGDTGLISSTVDVAAFDYAGGFWTQQGSLANPTNRAFGYGEYVCLLGSTALVSDSARGYIFYRSGNTWTNYQALNHTESTGSASSVDGPAALTSLPSRTVAALGYPNANAAPAVGGAVFIFAVNSLVGGSMWNETGYLHPTDAAASDFFGTSVALSGTSVIVGAPGDDNINGSNAGAAYVFTSNNLGGAWTQQAKLIASDGQTNDGFGQRVAVSGDTAAILSSGPANTASTIYLFTRTAGIWSQKARLVSIPNNSPNYVYRLILSGDRLLFSVPEGTIPGHPARTGYVAIYARPAGSGIAGNWSLETTYAPETAQTGDRVGYSVAITTNGSGITRVLDGAPITPFATNPNAGRAYFETLGRTCPADFDCSGQLEVADIFSFLQAWFAGTNSADFDGSGTLQVADIFAFLTAWFAGC